MQYPIWCFNFSQARPKWIVSLAKVVNQRAPGTSHGEVYSGIDFSAAIRLYLEFVFKLLPIIVLFIEYFLVFDAPCSVKCFSRPISIHYSNGLLIVSLDIYHAWCAIQAFDSIAFRKKARFDV